MKQYNLKLESDFIENFNAQNGFEQKRTLQALEKIIDEKLFGDPPPGCKHLAITGAGVLKD